MRIAPGRPFRIVSTHCTQHQFRRRRLRRKCARSLTSDQRRAIIPRRPSTRIVRQRARCARTISIGRKTPQRAAGRRRKCVQRLRLALYRRHTPYLRPGRSNNRGPPSRHSLSSLARFNRRRSRRLGPSSLPGPSPNGRSSNRGKSNNRVRCRRLGPLSSRIRSSAPSRHVRYHVRLNSLALRWCRAQCRNLGRQHRRHSRSNARMTGVGKGGPGA